MSTDLGLPLALVLSCEHGGRRVPREYAALFRDAGPLLDSHRGWDPGALVLARSLARRFGAPLLEHTVTRLLADANRSPGHRRLFSEVTRPLPVKERRRIIELYHRPHRDAVEEDVRALIARSDRPVLHLSVHSFTPVFDGHVRTVDIGLLYDPARKLERDLATHWHHAWRSRRSDLRVRRNQPYRGAADGLVTSLRRKLPADRYLGFELEVSSAFPAGSPGVWATLQRDVAATLEAATERFGGSGS